ncbi:MAG: hypothetical protein KDD33_07265 [Bdellovibrionales bacterium]|nr:hypothetical protein [Bdellovibrionales bacterium]
MKILLIPILVLCLLTLVSCATGERGVEVEMEGDYELEWGYQTLDPDKQMEIDQQFLLKSQRKAN